MKLRSKRAEDLTLPQIVNLLQFRRKREVVITPDGHYDPCVCPTCHTPPDIDYMKFCSNCGQRLSWTTYHKTIMREEWAEKNTIIMRKCIENAYLSSLIEKKEKERRNKPINSLKLKTNNLVFNKNEKY